MVEYAGMNTPENYQGHSEVKPEGNEEQRLEELNAAADAARVAGVYDPSEAEKGE